MQSMTAYLEPEQVARLREVVARTHVPLSTLIRRGIDEVLRREGESGNIPGYERNLFEKTDRSD